VTKDELLKRANLGIVGINAELQVFGGYDQQMDAAGAEPPTWLDPDEYVRMPASERIALADHMIDLWRRYREAASRGDL
jgi:hypothetical protein